MFPSNLRLASGSILKQNGLSDYSGYNGKLTLTAQCHNDNFKVQRDQEAFEQYALECKY